MIIRNQIQCNLREEDNMGAIQNRAILSLVERLNVLFLVQKEIWGVLQNVPCREVINILSLSQRVLKERFNCAPNH